MLSLRTEKLRLEFPRFPWYMRACAGGESEQAIPFFNEQCYDRAYGLHYEIPPLSFDKGSDMGVDDRLTVWETVAVTPGEAFFGFGERFTPLDK